MPPRCHRRSGAASASAEQHGPHARGFLPCPRTGNRPASLLPEPPPRSYAITAPAFFVPLAARGGCARPVLRRRTDRARRHGRRRLLLLHPCRSGHWQRHDAAGRRLPPRLLGFGGLRQLPRRDVDQHVAAARPVLARPPLRRAGRRLLHRDRRDRHGIGPRLVLGRRRPRLLPGPPDARDPLARRQQPVAHTARCVRRRAVPVRDRTPDLPRAEQRADRDDQRLVVDERLLARQLQRVPHPAVERRQSRRRRFGVQLGRERRPGDHEPRLHAGRPAADVPGERQPGPHAAAVHRRPGDAGVRHLRQYAAARPRRRGLQHAGRRRDRARRRRQHPAAVRAPERPSRSAP